MAGSSFNKEPAPKAVKRKRPSNRGGQLGREQRDAGSKFLTIATSPVNVPVGAADSVLQSVDATADFLLAAPIRKLTGFEPKIDLVKSDDIANLYGNIPFVGTQYQDHQKGFRMVGDIATMFVVPLKAAQAIQVGGRLDKGLKAVGASEKLRKRVLSSPDALSRSVAKLEHLAESKMLTGALTINKKDKDVKAARKEIWKQSFANNIKEGIAGDLALYTTLNQSELLFPEGVTKRDIAEGAALIPGISIIAGSFRTGFATRTGLAKATKSPVVLAARELRGLTQGVDSRPGLRGDPLISAAMSKEVMLTDAATTVDKVASGRLSAQAGAMDTIIGQELGKLSTDTYFRNRALSNTNGAVNFKASPEQDLLLRTTLANNPKLFEGALSINSLDGLRSFDNQQAQLITDIGDELSAAVKAKNPDKAELLRRLKFNMGRATSHIIEQDGMVISNLERQTTAFDKNTLINQTVLTPSATRKGGFAEHPSFTIVDQTGGTMFVMDATGVPKHTANGKAPTAVTPTKLTRASLFEHTAYYKLGRDKLIPRLLKDVANKAVKLDIDLPVASTTHVQLDMILAASKQATPEQADALLAAIPRFNTFDEIQYESLALKFDSMARTMVNEAKGLTGGASFVDHGKRLNMNLANEEGRASLLATFMESFLANERKDFRATFASIKDFENAFNATIANVLGVAGKDAEKIAGQYLRNTDMFEMPKGRAVGIIRDVPDNSEQALGFALVARRARAEQDGTIGRIQELVTKQESPFVGPAANTIAKNAPTVEAARRVELMQGSSLAQGNAGITTTIFNARDVPALRDMHVLMRAVHQSQNDAFARIVAPHKQAFDRLGLTKNLADKAEFEIFLTSRQGFDFASDDVGKSFLLRDTARTREKWTSLFPEIEFPEGALLPDIRYAAEGRYVPVQLGDNAQEALKGVRAIDEVMFQEARLLNRATRSTNGSPRANMHVPAPVVRGKEMAFIIDSQTGKPVFTSLGTDADNARQLAETELSKMGANNGRQLTVVDRRDDAFGRSIDSAFDTGLQDYNAFINQAKGLGTVNIGRTVQVGTGLDDILGQLHNRSRVLVNSTTRAHFANEIAQAKLFKALDAKAGVNAPVNKQGQAKFTGVYDRYVNALFGRTDTPAGSLVNMINDPLVEGYERAANALREINENTLKVHNPFGPRSAKNMEKLGAELKARHGFAPLDEALEIIKAPRQLRKDLAALNGLTAFLALRFPNASHAALNILSVPTTAAAAATHLLKRKGEAFATWEARVGPLATMYPNSQVAAFSPAKATAAGIAWTFTKEGKAVFKEAASLGYIAAPTSEAAAQAAKQGGGKFDKLYNHTLAQGAILTRLTDNSEELSRKMSFAVGYKIAQASMKGADKNRLMLFANRFADDSIGDYRGSIKGSLFQRETGLPLGLFQTYMTNYYQQIARAIETGDNRALFVRTAVQASTFGLASTPGYDIFSTMFGESYDGSENVYKSLSEGLGSNGANALLEGGISSLTGMGFTDRGDTNMQRVPFDVRKPLDRVPYGALYKKSAYAADEVLTGLHNGGLSPSRLAEIFAYSSLNRLMRGLGEIAIGHSTDKAGDMVTEDTRTFMNASARLLSMKTAEEARLASNLWQAKKGLRVRTARVANLRRDAVALARKGKLTDKKLDEFYDRYVLYGRKPKYWKTWLKGVYKKANITKTDTAIDKWTSSGKQEQADRILFADDDQDP